jgi:hypothetical protein
VRAVGRADREPELNVARGEYAIATGRGVDQHERRGVPRRLTGILRRHGDHGAVAAPLRLPDVQAFSGERPDLARVRLDHPEPAPDLPVFPGVHGG